MEIYISYGVYKTLEISLINFLICKDVYSSLDKVRKNFDKI